MSNEQKPSADDLDTEYGGQLPEHVEAKIRAGRSDKDPRKLAAALSADVAWLLRDIDSLRRSLARVRREARAEAFEQAGWACLALSEGADQSVQCAKRIAELAAKERAQ